MVALIFSGCEGKKKNVTTGETAPLFSALDITGKSVRLDQLKGNIVVVYFWQNSCCADSLKLVEPLYRKNSQKDLVILAVNVGDTKEVVTSYTKNNGLTFKMLTDENGSIFKQYQAFGFPTIFIIDKNGVIREKILGNIQTDKLEKLIQRQIDIQKEAEASYNKNHPR